jgi:UDP:flavonoid glycosyltransferase YjiC (YdhE family)
MKLGFVSMPVTGHLNPMPALARKLQSRGNEVGQAKITRGRESEKVIENQEETFRGLTDSESEPLSESAWVVAVTLCFIISAGNGSK